jgi:tetratricopeptide (TPR) repeat protein
MYMGTVDYMAPEQADDAKKANHRADIYSLGCTLYFLLTGHPPFGGDTVLKRLLAHQEHPAPSLHAARDDVPAALEAAYQTMMAKRPGDRPRSMTEVVALLEGCRTSADDVKEAHAHLKRFAETVMKRAAPRRRDLERDPSVFARPTEPEFPHFNPDLHLEDLVMDFRPEPHLGPLPEEKLPPKPPRFAHAQPHEPARRRPPVLPLGVLALLVLGVAGFLLMILTRSARVADSKRGGPAPKVAVANSKVAGQQDFRPESQRDPLPAAATVAAVEMPRPEAGSPQSPTTPTQSTVSQIENNGHNDALTPENPTAPTPTPSGVTTPAPATTPAPGPETKKKARPIFVKKPRVYNPAYPPRVLVDAERDRDSRIAAYTEAIRMAPNAAFAYRERGEILARQAKWSEALADFSRLVTLTPDDADGWHSAGAILARTGTFDQYHEFCRQMLARFSQTADPVIAERTAKTCLLLPLPQPDLDAACRLADRAIALGKNHEHFRYFQLAQALADYRSREFQAAATTAEDAVRGLAHEGNCFVPARFVQAMAYHQLGENAKSRSAWKEAEQADWTNSPSSDLGGGWREWIYLPILRREAEELLTKSGRQ